MMKYLIVNADDYGHTPGISAGIRKAHLEGIVTSTSAMMNSLHIDKELPRLIALCPRIGIGVHLVMTHGNPLLPASSLPTLMSLSIDGQRFNHDPLEQIDRIDPQEVRAEWQAQIEKFIHLTGRVPDHLDAHHHAMCFGDPFFKVYLKLASQYGCGVRPPVEGSPRHWYQMAYDHKIPMPERLDTRFYDIGVTEAMLEVMITDIPESVSEWMCHPACVDAELKNISDYHDRRVDELNLLISPNLRHILQKAGVELITFGQLCELKGGTA
jgi:predicted glycoside hydrolase/deacetylase ChbG (UPF0249 family)